MRIERFLVHRCTIVRNDVVTGQDPYGRDIYGEETEEGIPCRVDQIRKRSTQDEYGTDYVTQNMIFLSKKQSVSRGHIFRDLMDAEGNRILTGEYGVEQIIPVYKRQRLSHYEVTLTEVS